MIAHQSDDAAGFRVLEWGRMIMSIHQQGPTFGPERHKGPKLPQEAEPRVASFTHQVPVAGLVGRGPDSARAARVNPAQTIVRRNGLRQRRKPAETVTFTVGSREAFFSGSRAKHAVYRIDGVVYGLAGDFGGVDMGPDQQERPQYSWAGGPIQISVGQADTFKMIAQRIARKMTYNLLTQNCYSPVVGALEDLINQFDPGEQDLSEGDKAIHPHVALTKMKDELAKENWGAGQQNRVSDAKRLA